MTTKRMTKKEQERLEAIEHIKKMVKPGDTIYTILRSVSRSGMTRHIDVVAIKDNQHIYLSYNAAKALDWPTADDGSIKVGGCGMDMGFHLVYSLGWAVFGKEGWECVGEHCPNNSHVNDYHAPRGAGVHHTESGYAFKQSWL